MIEHTISFGDQNGLVGTLCLPQHGHRPDAVAGIVLFNAGIIHRIGPHRFNVRLARALSKLGIPSIRFDLSGLGDSVRADGDIGFEAQAIKDISAAMTALGDAVGLQRFGLFGICSGAFHSYNAARADRRVVGLMLFDAFRYQTPKSNLIRLSLRFKQHGVLRTSVRLTVKTLRQAIGALWPNRTAERYLRTPDVGYIVDTTSKASFAQGIRELQDRGVNVAMAFAGEGFEVYNYERQFHDAFRHLGIMDRIRVVFLPDIDHVATGNAAQIDLIQHVLRWSAITAEVAPGLERTCEVEPDAGCLLRGECAEHQDV